MTGILCALAGSGARSINFDDASVTRNSVSFANATYEIRNTGFVWSTNPSSGNLVQGAQWVAPTTEASSYEVFATLLSGSLSGGPVGAWRALDSDRNWNCLAFGSPGVSQSATLAFQLRRIGTTDVLDTWTVSLRAEVI